MPVPQKARNFGSKGSNMVKSSCCKKFAKAMFSSVGLFIIVAIYAILGAYLFISLEKPAEELRRDKKVRVALDLLDAKNYISKLLWYNNDQNHTKESYDLLVKKNLNLLHEFVVDKSSDSLIKYDGHVDTWDYDWTFSKSLLYTFTSMSAIGYGHISPKTYYGRIVTVLYNIIGVPLLLVFLANIGDFLANSYRYIYSRLCCRCCRIRRKLYELLPGASLEKKVLWKEMVGAEDYMPSDVIVVPITLNLVVLFTYLVIGGALFSSWEDWDLMSSIYFCFITLTTIGFGDYCPGNSFLDGGDPTISAIKMIVTVFYCLFGMALLSMCINLMQEQLVDKCRWFALQVGITEEEVDPVVKYKIKKSKNVPVTPANRDGNNVRIKNDVFEGESTTQNPNKGTPYSPITSRPHSTGRPKSKMTDDLLLSDPFDA